VAYLNGSKVLTTGSALTFDGTTLTGTSATSAANLVLNNTASGTQTYATLNSGATVLGALLRPNATNDIQLNANFGSLVWGIGSAGTATEQMRLTSTGLGIGTSSPSYPLHVERSSYGVTGYFYTNDGTGNPRLVISGSSSGTTIQNTWSTGASNLIFANGGAIGSGTEVARFDASGNLGLGVTPSAWNSGYKAFVAGGTNGNDQVGGIASGSGITIVSTNYFRSSTPDEVYGGTGFAMKYVQSSGQHQWYTAPSGTAGNAISFTQAMTLDASGNLGVGTTSPGARLHAYSASGQQGMFSGYSTIAAAANVSNGNLTVGANASYQLQIDYDAASNTIATIKNNYANTGSLLQIQSGYITFGTGTSFTERARITSGGYFKASNTGTYVGSTSGYHELRTDNNTYIAYFTNSNAAPNGTVIEYGGAAPNGTGNRFLYCGDTGAERASIRSNGGLANYSGNDVNLSDRREKTNFAPAKSYLDTICAIPVQTFNYIDQSEDDPGLTLGVVAQDVQAVAPELVMESDWGTKDDPKMRLSIYQTDLQYALMKCIQELKSELDSVKAELATLKGNP
jgi:hypothetical protein